MVSWLPMTVYAHGEHLDVRPYVSGGKIVTGAAELDGAIVDPVSDLERVFGVEFGEDDPGQPFFTEDPGFLSEPGAFPGGEGAFVGFNATAGLSYWTGSGFGAVPASETLQITFGSQSVNVATAPVAGFDFAVIDGDEALHEHLDHELYGSDGNAVPASTDGIEATAGIYLLELELTTTMTGVSESDPFWIVFNAGGAEVDHEAAIEWVEINLVPEPASALFVALGGLFALMRRRRAS